METPIAAGPLDRRVGRLLLRCPKCRRTQHTDRQEHDYPEAVRLEIVCPECDDGDFHEPFYYDENGKHICRDPDELPNAKSEPTPRLFAEVGSTDGLCGNGSEVGAGGTAVDISQAPDIHAELTMAAFHREVAK